MQYLSDLSTACVEGHLSIYMQIPEAGGTGSGMETAS